MKKMVSGLAVGVLALGAVTACGGSSSSSSSGSDDYCTALKDADAKFSAVGNGDVAQFGDAFDALRHIDDIAPDNIKPQWDTLTGALDQFQAALDKAGVTMDQLAQLKDATDPSQLPSGLDPAKLQQLGTDLQAIGNADVQKASDDISKDAKDTCGIDLGNSSSSSPSPSQ